MPTKGDSASMSSTPDLLIAKSALSKSADVTVTSLESKIQPPSTTNIKVNMKGNVSSEVPDMFNLIEFLKKITHYSEAKIKHTSKCVGVPINERPSETKLNDLLNYFFDNVIEVPDSDTDISRDPLLDSSNSVKLDVNAKEQTQVSSSKPILKPATLVVGGNSNAPMTNCKKFDRPLPLPLRIPNGMPIKTFENEARSSTISRDFPASSTTKHINCNCIEKNYPGDSRHYGSNSKGSNDAEYRKINNYANSNWMDDMKNFEWSDRLRKRGEIIIKEKPSTSVYKEEATGSDQYKQLQPPNNVLHHQEAASGYKMQEKRSEPFGIKEEPIIPKMKEEPVAELPRVKEEPAANQALILRMMEIFPDASSDFIKKLCRNKDFVDVDNMVTEILSLESYPRRQQRLPSPPKEYDIEEQLEIVKALLPDADPTYLRLQCEKYGKNTEQLNQFINEARENENYPTMKEYLRKQKLSAQSRQYTTEFNVEKFVELFPDPEKTFRDPTRKVTVDNYTKLYIINFFQNRYDRLGIKNIRYILIDNKNNTLTSDDEMKDLIKRKEVLKHRRKNVKLPDPPQNIAILQELAYLTYKEEIDNYIKQRAQAEVEEQKVAKEANLLKTCECCFDDEVMPKDTFCCPTGCSFCRNCIQKSCEVAMGDGKTDFNCLNDCSDEFTLQTLQKVLPPKLFSKLAQKKALAEVKAAGIEELESCPFCDFASIPNPTDKVFRCFNPECTKESCRLCKEENHIPYKCEEVERDADVKARVFIENEMTEALLRKCWNCNKSFFKEEGCNKMTCTCGAHMCYICKQPVKDYSHFNGLGGDKYHLCPLYTDTNDFNQKNVIKAAELAKTKVDPSKLKIDPTLDIKQHYEKRKEKLAQEPHIRILQDMQVAHRHALAAPVQAAPVQAAPVQAAPVQVAPVQAAPLQAAPVQAAPVQAAPFQAAPVQAAPVQAAPVQAAPVQAAPFQAAPVQAAPFQAAPVQAAPVQAAPVLATPVHPAPFLVAPARVPHQMLREMDDRLTFLGNRIEDLEERGILMETRNGPVIGRTQIPRPRPKPRWRN